MTAATTPAVAFLLVVLLLSVAAASVLAMSVVAAAASALAMSVVMVMVVASAATVVTAATATAFAAEHLCHGLDFSHSGRTRGHHFAAEVQVFAGQRMVEVHLDLAVRHLEDEALEAVAVGSVSLDSLPGIGVARVWIGNQSTG